MDPERNVKPETRSSTEAQKIVWSTSSDIQSSSINSSDVTIDVAHCGQTALGSSAVVVKSIIDYPFVLPTNHSTCLAVHRSQNFIAYALHKNNMTMVRIMNTVTNARSLFKTNKGMVTDMAFAWTLDSVMLAFIDVTGTFYVLEVVQGSDEKELSIQTILTVEGDATLPSLLDDSSSQSQQNRVTWCRYMPEFPNEPQPADGLAPYILAVTIGSRVEMWQMSTAVANKCTTPLQRPVLHEALEHIFNMQAEVTATAISPDSTCIAIATADGTVLFFQTDDESDEEKPSVPCGGRVHEEGSCVHKWSPHGKQPLSCLYFLDNLTAMADVGIGSFWKYALTGCRDNTELKLWTCQDWKCSQTIRFNLPSHGGNTINGGGAASAPPSTRHSPSMRCASLSPSFLQQKTRAAANNNSGAAGQPSSPFLNVSVDESANFILLMDRTRKALYMLMLESVTKNSSSGVNDCDREEKLVKRAVSVSEMPVTFSPLNAVITSAKRKNYQRWQLLHQEPSLPQESQSLIGNGADSDFVRGVVMHCNLLTTKSIYQCVVRLQPDTSDPASPTRDNAAADDTLDEPSVDTSRDVHDGLTDVSMSLPDDAPVTAADSGIATPPAEELPSMSLSGLLPPTVFTAPKDTTPSPPTDVTSPVPAQPELDPTLDNKANPTLAALLKCPENIQASVLAAVQIKTAAEQQPSPAAAPACSSTSSPSLEIQQILQLQDDGKSSGASSSSNSRGPTQLDMAADANSTTAKEQQQSVALQQPQVVPPKVPDTPQSPDALQQLLNNTRLTVTEAPTPQYATTAPSSATDILSRLLSNGVSAINNSNTNVESSNVTPKTTGRDEQLSDEARQRQSVRENHQKLVLAEQQHKKVVDESASDAAPEAACFLQALLPGLALQSPAVPSAVNNKPLFSEGGCDGQMTCEELESQIKGNTTSNSEQPSGVPFDSLQSYLKSLPTVPAVAASETIDNDDTAVYYTSEDMDSFCKSHTTADLLSSTHCDTAAAAEPLPSSNGDIQCPATEAAGSNIPPLMSLSTAAPGNVSPQEVVSLLTADASTAAAPVTANASTSVDLAPAVVELKELRSTVLSTQQQIAKLNRKLDELTNKLSKDASQNNSRSVAAAITPAVDEAVRATIRQALPQCVSSGLQSAVGQQMPYELQRMIEATETRLAENITKMLHSKSFSDTLSSAVCSAVSASVMTACRDSYTKLVLPGFQNLTQRILQQFNDLFHKGTAEYLNQVTGEVSQVMTAIDSSVTPALRELEANKAAAAQMIKTQHELLQQQKIAFQQYSSHIVTESAMRRVVAEEVSRALASMQRAPPPGTPASAYYGPGPDKAPSPKQAQLQLEQLIAAKQFNSAFKQALSANDLSQVLFVCERVNRESLMTAGQTKLSQEVLMSLINQLSHDLGQKTDLKMKFLEDAMLCLELQHPVTREHIAKVVSSLHQNVTAYLEGNPPAHTINRFKMLLLAANHHAAVKPPSS